MNFNQTVEFLFGLQKFGTKLGLENTRRLLDILGHPERGRRFLHVTGTNGKGSVSALLASALREAGYRTGLYTSPHLVSFTERMTINGDEISEEEVARLADRLKRLLENHSPSTQPTFFEFTTAMAFDYFRDMGAEAVVLEVGMGGRLDSTNVITPECAVITNVEMEHREYLGDTIEAIAREKAGIVKPGVPLVTSERKPGVLDYIEGVCREKNAPVYIIDRDYGYHPLGHSWKDGKIIQEFDFWGPGGEMNGLTVPLGGEHQLRNAATALCALSVMSGMAVSEDALKKGFSEVRWEGRLETVSQRPLVVLDGAHNADSARTLSAAIRKYYADQYEKLFLVLGVLADKDFREMADCLLPLADKVIFTQADYNRAVPAAELSEKIDNGGKEAAICPDVPSALEKALSEAGPDDMVLVTGSLYVVGEAKAWLSNREQFLKA
ncbi:MAG: bifunctional folylpolyglutamate synthase/dihydrofolate synthase [Nitrospirota bacterium]